MPNIGLYIDEERDLVLEGGDFRMTENQYTVAQCVRATLEVYKKEWFLDERHGTDYERVMGIKPRATERVIKSIIREAIMQEGDVKHVTRLDVAFDGRKVTTTFEAVLRDGAHIAMEVSA